jgi:hypothetical protein
MQCMTIKLQHSPIAHVMKTLQVPVEWSWDMMNEQLREPMDMRGNMHPGHTKSSWIAKCQIFHLL